MLKLSEKIWEKYQVTVKTVGWKENLPIRTVKLPEINPIWFDSGQEWEKVIEREKIRDWKGDEIKARPLQR